jgi:N-glycosylase/DNA lyase
MTSDTGTLSPQVLEATVQAVAMQIARATSHETASYRTERSLFRELVGCILGSQVTFEQALAATKRVHRLNISEAIRATGQRSSLTHAVQKALRGRNGSETRYRFWRVRSAFVVDTAFEVYVKRDGLRCLLDQTSDQRMRRQLIADVAKGVGPKQASLFLRNTGYGSDLAILDVHVLRFMQCIGLSEDGPGARTITNLKKYEAYERRLSEYARRLGWALDIFDQAIWVSMRVAQRMPQCQ